MSRTWKSRCAASRAKGQLLDHMSREMRTPIDTQVGLLQVLGNLSHNAIKFTASGTVAVEALLNETDVDSVLLEFAVRDTGMGIAPRDRHRVFSFPPRELLTAQEQGRPLYPDIPDEA